MPISAIDGCDEQHWLDVKAILFDAIHSANLHPELVSNADDVGVIQARIVKNLYENPIVVCDVSARNANVMFELGMRLAFDKPTVIVIDEKTPFSFDTSPIEHLRYPRDLRYGKIQKFKEELAFKLTAVLKSAQDAGYSTFLKHFGSFTASKLEKKELAPADFVDFVTQKLTDLDENLARVRAAMSPPLDVNVVGDRSQLLTDETIELRQHIARLQSRLRTANAAVMDPSSALIRDNLTAEIRSLTAKLHSLLAAREKGSIASY